MSWWSTALEIAPYVYDAISTSDSFSDSADDSSSTAMFNALAIRSAGDANANAIMALGNVKAAATMMAYNATRPARKAITEYKAKYVSTVGHYNGLLLEQEAAIIWEATGLELEQLENAQRANMGRLRVSHGASGAIMDQDSSKVAQDSLQDRQDLEKFIVRRGADIRMAKLYDKAAMSRWAGNMEANKIVTEGALLDQSGFMNAALSSYGTSIQATVDADTTRYNSMVKSLQTLFKGDLDSSNADDASDSAFWSGIFSAGTKWLSSYISDSDTDSDSGWLSSLLDDD